MQQRNRIWFTDIYIYMCVFFLDYHISSSYTGTEIGKDPLEIWTSCYVKFSLSYLSFDEKKKKSVRSCYKNILLHRQWLEVINFVQSKESVSKLRLQFHCCWIRNQIRIQASLLFISPRLQSKKAAFSAPLVQSSVTCTTTLAWEVQCSFHLGRQRPWEERKAYARVQIYLPGGLT